MRDVASVVVTLFLIYSVVMIFGLINSAISHGSIVELFKNLFVIVVGVLCFWGVIKLR